MSTRLIYWQNYLDELNDAHKTVTLLRASLHAICADWDNDRQQWARDRATWANEIRHLQTECRRLERLTHH
jgi:hypothetical protein